MALLADEDRMAGLGWNELASRCWAELVEAGLPCELADLGRDLSRRSGRMVRLFSVPMDEAGIAGLAVPFMKEDWVLFDPALLGTGAELTGVIARELAHLLYPGWRQLYLEEYDEIERFVSALTPVILERLPRRFEDVVPVVDQAMHLIEAA